MSMGIVGNSWEKFDREYELNSHGRIEQRRHERPVNIRMHMEGYIYKNAVRDPTNSYDHGGDSGGAWLLIPGADINLFHTHTRTSLWGFAREGSCLLLEQCRYCSQRYCSISENCKLIHRVTKYSYEILLAYSRITGDCCTPPTDTAH